MRKINFVAIMLFCGLTVFGQAVKDRNVIPVAVNLNQVLRMTVTNGGNIEFVFNTIDQYKNGLSAATATTGVFYETDFTIASSTRWKLTYGAETSTFVGTDNPANQLALDNVGFELTESGAHSFEATLVKATTAGAELYSAPTFGGAEVAALEAYPVVLIEDNDQAGADASANAGDATDNTFKMSWRCGTKESQGLTTPMNAVALIDQQPTPTPDRYVVNVLFDLSIDEL
ncbi:MAG TPA: hypothetical protein VI413_09610 [Paludibacter sp.]